MTDKYVAEDDRPMTQEEIDEAHEELLRDFISSDLGGLRGMLLIGIRDTSEATAIEIRGGSSVDDALRAAMTILEGAMTNNSAGEPRMPDKNKRAVVAKIIDVLAEITGSIGKVVVAEDEDGSIVEVTRPSGPGLENDDDETRH